MQTLSRGIWDPVPQPGIEQGPPHWEHGVSATGPPGKSCLLLNEWSEWWRWRFSIRRLKCFHKSIGQGLCMWLSCGFYDKWQQAGVLKTKGIHPPPALEIRHLNQGVGRAVLSQEAPGDVPSSLYQILGALGISGLVVTSLPTPSSCGFSLGLSSSVSYKDTVIGSGPPSSRMTSSQLLH